MVILGPHEPAVGRTKRRPSTGNSSNTREPDQQLSSNPGGEKFRTLRQTGSGITSIHHVEWTNDAGTDTGHADLNRKMSITDRNPSPLTIVQRVTGSNPLRNPGFDRNDTSNSHCTTDNFLERNKSKNRATQKDLLNQCKKMEIILNLNNRRLWVRDYIYD